MLQTSTTPVLGLFAKKHLAYEIDRVHESPIVTPSIKDMAVKALDLLKTKAGTAMVRVRVVILICTSSDFMQALLSLSSPSPGNKGFFLLVEGAKIDKAAHPNDAATVLREVLAYDEANQNPKPNPNWRSSPMMKPLERCWTLRKQMARR